MNKPLTELEKKAIRLITAINCNTELTKKEHSNPDATINRSFIAEEVEELANELGIDIYIRECKEAE